MGNIVLLDDLTINKIAAGEVIERPASVVKEVVENSIDAGADNISVEIKNGGISYIRITDNGKGIAADDLEIAFERHATSKIRKAEDLETVKSMGFRGEALASIAAIARVELVTKTADSDIGHRIIVEGGKIILKEETGCPKGTTITIENLFYNTPVRYKFLKKDFTESGYIEDNITRIALVNPDIAIKFVNSGKTILQTSGNGNIKDIVYGIYGKDIAENIIDVDYKFEDMAVKGVIGKPSIARSNRANQLFFVNKRYVKDKTLTSAAEQAFKGILPIGKFGFLILNVEMDPHKLDVNVHPAKLEVRFQEENKVFKLIYHAIKESLLETDIAGNAVTTQNQTKENNYNEGMGKMNFNINNELKEELSNYNIGSKTEENKNTNEENTENKGISGFLKNILGGQQKNEFNSNSDNLVELLYKDKIQHEKDMLFNNFKDETINTNNNATNTAESSLSDAQQFDNIIVKEDGGIELKTFNKQENSIAKDLGLNLDDIKPNSNLEKLVKELDANLEKLNLKPRQYDSENLDKDINASGSNNEIKEQPLNTENTSESADNIIIDNIIKETAETTTEEDVQANVENTGIEEAKVENEKIEETAQEELNSEKEQNTTSEQIPEQNKNEINKEDTQEIKTNRESEIKFEEMYAKMFGTVISDRNKEKEQEQEETYSVKQEDLRTVENVSLFTNNSFYNRPVYKYIGIAFGSYIVIEYEKEMYIVDQKAAHERILYEKVKKNYYSENDKDSQLMLLPDIINLTPKEMAIAKDNMQLFKNAGFDLEEFGENTIKLNGVPNICIDLDTRQLFIDILEEINTVARTAKHEIEEKFIATIACKAAPKVNYALTVSEVDNLMQSLLVLPQPFVSPNGNPTAIRMSKTDIEKKFSRR